MIQNNGQDGVALYSGPDDVEIADCDIRSNGGNGVELGGDDIHINGCDVVGNDVYGVEGAATRLRVTDTLCQGMSRGFALYSATTGTIGNSVAEGNGGVGLRVDSDDVTVTGFFSRNNAVNYDLSSGVTEAGNI